MSFSVRNGACTLCPRNNNAAHICMWGRGNPQAEIAVILDTPSRNADFQGALLDTNLRRWMFNLFDLVGLKVGVDIYVTYAVKCGGENKKPNAKSVRECSRYLLAELAQLPQLRLVIGMGPVAASALLGKGAPTSIKKLRNRILEIPDASLPGVKAGFTFSPRILALEPQQINTLVSDLQMILGHRTQQIVQKRYVYNQWIPREKIAQVRLWGFDIETDGLIPYDPSKRILTAALSDSPGGGYGLSIGHKEAAPGRDVRVTQINEIVTNPHNTLSGHSIKYDILWWEVKNNVEVEADLFDSKVAFSLLDENAPDNSLKHLCAVHTDLGHYADAISKDALADTPVGEVLEYNVQDSDGSRRVVESLHTELKKQGLTPLFNFLMEAEKVLIEIERTGVWIDKPWAIKVGTDTYRSREEARERIHRLAGKAINMDAPKQVGWFLYDHLGFPIIETTKTNEPSTSKATLVDLLYLPRLAPQQIESIEAVNDFKKANKQWVTYFLTLYEYLKYDGRVHTTYNVGRGFGEDDEEHGAVTGRLSSSSPNLQNIPIGSKMRGMFAATGVYSITNPAPGAGGVHEFVGEAHSEDWAFIGADYSQLEIRVAAFVSQEPALMAAFDAGRDVHTSTLADITGTEYAEAEDHMQDKGAKDYEVWKNKRIAVKKINFGVLYGIGYRKLTQQLRAMGVVLQEDEVRSFMEKWFASYKRVTKWIRQTEDEAIEKGQVRCPFGRIRHLLGASRDSDIGARLLRQAVNTPIQATASEICLIAMIKLHEEFKRLRQKHQQPVGRLVLQVHDMLGAEFNKKFITPEEMKATFSRFMVSQVIDYIKERFGIRWNVPLEIDIDIANRWA